MTGDVLSSGTSRAEPGPWVRETKRFLWRLGRRKTTIVGGAVVLLFLALAIFAPLLAPYDPIAGNWAAVRKAPSAAHWLGTDELGRDLLSRIIWGARASLSAGCVSVGLALALGVPMGLAAGYAGGWTEAVLMRLTDAMLASGKASPKGKRVGTEARQPD